MQTYFRNIANIKQKIYLTLIALLISSTLFGKGKGDWHFPDLFGYSPYSGDTGYYAMIGGHDSLTPEVDWIRKGSIIYFYYPGGNLCAEATIKESGFEKELDPNDKIHMINYYVLNGPCIIYYDDSIRLIAAKGECKDNKTTGIWNYYDKKGRLIQRTCPMWLWDRSYFYDSTGTLIRQTDKVLCVKEKITVHDITFDNGKKTVLVNKMLPDIVILRYMIPWMILLFIAFFSRVFINSEIYNRENNTNFSPIYFFAGPFVSNNFGHSIICTFTFWFFDYKPENKKLVILSNTLSVIALSMFFGWLILSLINGD